MFWLPSALGGKRCTSRWLQEACVLALLLVVVLLLLLGRRAASSRGRSPPSNPDPVEHMQRQWLSCTS